MKGFVSDQMLTTYRITCLTRLTVPTALLATALSLTNIAAADSLAAVKAAPLPATFTEQAMASVRYSSAPERAAMAKQSGSSATSGTPASSTRSPFVAFGLSLLVPGAGQIYNGDYVVAAGFLGVEAGTWIFESKYNTDGHNRTDKFQKFDRAHWSETRYRDYLEKVYGKRDDDSITATEISHNLPSDPNDQQYYEETGKYDQFAWGWDDAYLKTPTDSIFYNDTVVWKKATFANQLLPAAKGTNVPTTANRLIYEELRHDANRSFQYRDRMFLVAALNRIVSGVEAYLVARHRQKLTQKDSPASGFSAIEWTPVLSSRHTFADTPGLQFRMHF